MCSSTRGPASVPSLVTWPTRMTVVPRGLGHAGQLCGAVAHLGHRARRGAELVGVDGLDRVDHAPRQAISVSIAARIFSSWISACTRTGEAIEPEPPRAQRDLRAALLAGHVERRHLRVASASSRLQQQRALADARVAADQHHAAFDDAAAEHAVELFLAGGRAREVGRFDLGQGRHRLALRQRLEAVLRRRGALGHGFFQRVPGIAVRALAQPLGAGCRRIRCRCRSTWPCSLRGPWWCARQPSLQGGPARAGRPL